MTTLDITVLALVLVVLPAASAYLAHREQKRKLEAERTDNARTFFPDTMTEQEFREYKRKYNIVEPDDEPDFFPERGYPRGGTGLYEYETGEGE